MRLFNRISKVIVVLLVVLSLSQAFAEKIDLHKEYLYEFKKNQGPNQYQIQANLIANKAEYLMIEVESLTPRQDVFIYVSLQGKTATKQEDADLLCSRYDYDVCLIPQSLVKRINPSSDDFTATFTVFCNEDCSFDLFASYENSDPLPINDEKILIVKEQNQIEMTIDIVNTRESPINTFILTAELMNPMEVEHYFSMSLFPKDSSKPIFEAEKLGSGPIKGVYEIRGDKICKGQCEIYLSIEARKGSIIKINSIAYNGVRDIEPFKIYTDQVEANSQLLMKMDLNYFKQIESINLQQKTLNFQLVPKSGTCSISVNPGQQQPQTQSGYLYKSEEENSQYLRIRYDEHKIDDHVYWISINTKKSKCVFSIQVDFLDTQNQFLTINHPVSSITKTSVLDYYRLTLLGNHSQNIKVILHADNPLTELFVKLCKSEDDFTISMKDVQKKTGFLEYSGQQSSQSKIVKFTHNPENCPDFKLYKDVQDTFPSCTYLIALYSSSGITKYTLEALSSSKYINHINIRENESFFDSVSSQDDNIYRFQVFDDIDEVKFIAKPQFGQITFSAFYSGDGNSVDLSENAYPIQTSQWDEIIFKNPKQGFYYLSVFGNSESQYTVTPVVNRPETAKDIQIIKLKHDLPQQVIKEVGGGNSYFEINISNFEDQYPDIWLKLESNKNEYSLYLTRDRDILLAGDTSKFEFWFTKHSKTDMHLDGKTLSSIIQKKLYVMVVPSDTKISQFYVLKYHFSFSYSLLQYSKPVKGHITPDNVILYKVPVSKTSDLQITKTVVNSRQNTVRLQVDFHEAQSSMAKFDDEYYNDIVSIPLDFIKTGCENQKTEICFMYINVLSSEDCDYQLQVDEQIEGSIIMAYNGYSNLLLVPSRILEPIHVNFIINKPDVITITTQHAKGLTLCASIVNSVNQFEMIDYPKQNECQYVTDRKQYYDHQYLKISLKEVEDHCKFTDPRVVCGLVISIFASQDNDIRDKFRLSINSGVVDLNKGKPVIGHAPQQTMEYFKYVSKSEDPIKIQVTPLDSSDIDIFVVFGEENRPLPFKDYGWSLQLQNTDENILEISQPLQIQNGSLQGVYIIGVYSRFQHSRFQITVSQEILHVQELFQNSIYSYRLTSNQGVYLEYTPHPTETDFTIKISAEYGNPKIAVRKMTLGQIHEKSLPDIVNGEYDLTNRYDLQSDSLNVQVLDCDDCLYFIQVYSFSQNSKFSLQVVSTESHLILYNRVYSYQHQDKMKTQKFQYHSSEQGILQLNMEYGEADVEVEMNSQKQVYRLQYFINIPYAFSQDIQASVTCQDCSFSVTAFKYDDFQTYKYGQIKYLALQPNESMKIQFTYNPQKRQEETINFNLMVENEVSDEHSLLMYKPDVAIYFLEKKYDDKQEIKYKVHKFRESFTYQFDGKRGLYQMTIKWGVNPKLQGLQDKLYLKLFMSHDQTVFLKPHTSYSTHLVSGGVSEIVQKKYTSSMLIPEPDQGMEIVLHVCSGKLTSMAVFNETQFQHKEAQVLTQAFQQVAFNTYVFDSYGNDKELFLQLKSSGEDTYFNLHSQQLKKGQISLYRTIYLKDNGIVLEVQDDIVTLSFEGVQILDAFKQGELKPTIKYEIFFFKKMSQVNNQLCPQVDLLDLENDIPSDSEDKSKVSGLFLSSFVSNQFGNILSFSQNKKYILEDRNITEFYFTVQAKVNYNDQEAFLMYNIENVKFFSFPTEASQNGGINYFLYLIIAGSVVTIAILVFLVRRKMKYGLLPEVHDGGQEQVVQQETSQIKAPNHVISPNMSVADLKDNNSNRVMRPMSAATNFEQNA